MKKTIIKCLCGMFCVSLFISAIPVMATEVMAQLSTQSIYVDGLPVNMTSYSIDGNNYVRLRELGKAVNFSVFYDQNTNSVRITRDCPYVESENETL